MNSYDAMPYTTYWYYKNAKSTMCSCSGTENLHHLLRYRVHLSLLLFRIPTSTSYYLVCSNCGALQRLDSEGEVAKVVTRVQGVVPIKYNKYTQMDLDGFNEEVYVTFGTEKELKSKVRLHLNDLAKQQ